jgi:hypothetical protein
MPIIISFLYSTTQMPICALCISLFDGVGQIGFRAILYNTMVNKSLNSVVKIYNTIVICLVAVCEHRCSSVHHDERLPYCDYK